MATFNLPPDEPTIPARDRMDNTPMPPDVTPWALQQYFDGEIDLIQELSSRYPQLPIMSLFHSRTVGQRSPRAVASIATQDGAASMIVELDLRSGAVQFSFILASLIGMRFRPGSLTRLDRAAWVEPMRREASELAFLWNGKRWAHDFIISSSSKTFASLFAFSTSGAQAAARLTPEVNRKLLEWLGEYWL